MATPDFGDEFHVVVEADSHLSHWAACQGHRRNRSLTAIGAPDLEPMLFVADELLVGASDPDLVEALVDRHGAVLVPLPPLPHPPPGMEPFPALVHDAAAILSSRRATDGGTESVTGITTTLAVLGCT